jgi:hypothetical protein
MLGVHNLGPKIAVLLRATARLKLQRAKQTIVLVSPAHLRPGRTTGFVNACATLHLAALVSGGVAVQRSQGREFGRAAWPVRGWAGPGYGTIQRLSSIQTRDSDYLRPQTQTPV